MPNEDSEDSPPPPKRAQPVRGASTRGKRGQAATSQPSSSLAETRPTVLAAPPELNSPPPITSPAPVPGIQHPPQELSTSNDQILIGEPSTQGAAPTDINTVIAEIIDHGETVESHCASQGYAAMGMVDTESYSQLGASLHLKLQSLPILDNLVSWHNLLKMVLLLTNPGHTNHKHFGQVFVSRNPHHSYET